MREAWYSMDEAGLMLDVYIQPKASRNKICGIFDQRLKLQITAPPVDGQANKHLVKWLAKYLGIAKSSVTLVAGSSGRYKRIRIQHANPEQIVASLVASL